MGLNPHVLFSHLVSDLLPFIHSDHVIDAYMRRPISAPIGASIRTVASYALVNSFLKKFEDESNQVAEDEAVSLFRQMNISVKDGAPQAECLKDEYLLGLFREECFEFSRHEVLDHLDAPTIYRGARCGPGASIGSLGTDFYTKLCSGPLTCTSGGLYDLYRSAIVNDERALKAELSRLESFSPFTVVQGSRLSCVPKNDKIARTICTEPVLNMFFQLGLGAILERGLYRRYGISLSHQPEINSELAWSGSLTGRYSTIDLKSASDLISPSVLRWAFHPSFISWMDLFRSKTVEISGEVVDLKMWSTMGNGFTFPLQTVIFTCALVAAYKVHNIRLRKELRYCGSPAAGTFPAGYR